MFRGGGDSVLRRLSRSVGGFVALLRFRWCDIEDIVRWFWGSVEMLFIWTWFNSEGVPEMFWYLEMILLFFEVVLSWYWGGKMVLKHFFGLGAILWPRCCSFEMMVKWFWGSEILWVDLKLVVRWVWGCEVLRDGGKVMLNLLSGFTRIGFKCVRWSKRNGKGCGWPNVVP